MPFTRTASGQGTKGQSISIDGLEDVLRNLKRLGVEVDDLKALNFEAGVIIARKVVAPTDSGDMATTLRVAKAVREAKVTIGQKSKGWYAGFIEYGTKPTEKRNGSIAANPFLLEAKTKSLQEIYTHYETGIDTLIARYNLEG